MPLALGDIEFDEMRLFRQLRNDLKDDWFPDPILYSDMIDGGIVSERILDNFERNHGVFESAPRSLFNIPKPNFTLRYALEIGLEDRAIYQGICSYLIGFFDPLIPWYVFSHRQGHERSSDKYMFRHGIAAWRDFTEAVRTDVNPSTYLLSTDLTNYFENIDIGKLRDWFHDLIPELTISPNVKSCIRSHLRMLFDCLAKWSFDGKRGLAQNRDASSFLANIYMLQVDRSMRERGYRYYRYMDDIKIVTPERLSARRALHDLIIDLREIGLAVNAKKTILTPGTDEGVVRSCLDVASPEIERLGAIWQTRNRSVIARSFTDLRAKSEQLLEDGEVDSRDFRFCMNRMTLLASCSEFAVPPDFFARTTELVIARLVDNPAATDQFLKYLRVVALTNDNLAAIAAYVRDPARNFYGWQCYLLWVLLAERGYRDARLFRFALQSLSSEEGPNRAGATLYVGASGSNAGRRRIARTFGDLKTFFGQRIALISMHELRFQDGVSRNVAPHVRKDLKGVYRGLQSRRGAYIAPVPPVSITTYVDTERDYA